MKRQSGFTLIELLLVLAIIGIISAIAIPALLGQRARARDKSAISNMDGRVGDLVGQYDKLKEAGLTASAIRNSLGTYLTKTSGADMNPWSLNSGAFVTSITAGTASTQSGAVAALRTLAGNKTKGKAVFQLTPPGSGTPGFLGGAVLIDGIVNNSHTVVKVTAIE